VIFYPDKSSPAIVFSAPTEGKYSGHPDRILPVYNSCGLIGEIQIWRGVFVELPSEESRLLQNFTLQTGRAFERTCLPEQGKTVNGLFHAANSR
jgi:hypothetical protein